jgi:hypothetical protein
MLDQRQLLNMLTRYGLARLARKLRLPRPAAQTDGECVEGILALNHETLSLLPLLTRRDLQDICDSARLCYARTDRASLCYSILNPRNHHRSAEMAGGSSQDAIGQEARVGPTHVEVKRTPQVSPSVRRAGRSRAFLPTDLCRSRSYPLCVDKGEVLDDIIAACGHVDSEEAERSRLSFDHQDLNDTEAYWCSIRGFVITHTATDALIVCANCGGPVEFGEWGGKPMWRCRNNPRHRQRIARRHLRLPKMRELVPVRELKRLEDVLAGPGAARTRAAVDGRQPTLFDP